MLSTDPITSITASKWISTVPPSTNHRCPILSQYTASSPRNAQLSQLDLVSFEREVGKVGRPNILQEWKVEQLEIPGRNSESAIYFQSTTYPSHSLFILSIYIQNTNLDKIDPT